MSVMAEIIFYLFFSVSFISNKRKSWKKMVADKLDRFKTIIKEEEMALNSLTKENRSYDDIEGMKKMRQNIENTFALYFIVN